MARNTDLSSHNLLHSRPHHHNTSQVKGPFSFLNPTTAHIHNHKNGTAREPDDPKRNHFAFMWSSRDNRKGRHALVLSPSLDASPTLTPPKSSDPRVIATGIWAMFVEYPYWDVSWWVATIFTWGSVVWVINGFFSFLPLIRPSTTFSDESTVGAGVTAFIGATIFEFGSVLLMIEAINENRSDCFGWAIIEAVSGEKEKQVSFKPGNCSHHHANKTNFVGKGAQTSLQTISSQSSSTSDEDTPAPAAQQNSELDEKRKAWIWWPSWRELRGHYFHEIGFLACSAQMFGATIFWISGFTALPGILTVLSPGLEDGIYWVPQIIGGCGFIVSGFLFMIETQEKWWKPAPKVLGWHIGLNNLIGGIGFTLCPCFGLDTSSWAQYQAACTTFWASFFFLIGSVVQWYEAMQKHPVEVGEIAEGS